MVHQIGRHSAAAESLLPAAVTLADDHNVHLVVINDLEQRSTDITVQHVDRHVEALSLELLAVRVQALDGLLTQLLQELVLLLGVDGQGTRHPRARENVRRQDGSQENVAVRVESLLVQHVLEGVLTRLSTVHGQQNTVLVSFDVIASVTDNVLLARLGRERELVKRVARLQYRGLGNLLDPAVLVQMTHQHVRGAGGNGTTR